MTTVVIDPEGRLVRLNAVPPQVEARPEQIRPLNWNALFDAAGLDMNAFKPAIPEWTPLLYADTRAAWTGPQPGLETVQLRIEAAAYRGTPTYFQQVSPWTTPTRMPDTVAERTQVKWVAVIAQLVTLSMLIAAALIARHNLRKGRGDRRGAVQIAVFVSLAAVGVWLLDSKHVADPGTEMGRFFDGQPLWAAGLLWLLYLAVEPYVRRFWPATLVSWSRLMARQFRDPLVGRDILFGVALGMVVHVLGLLASYGSLRLGYPTTPQAPDLSELLGTAQVIARILNQVFNAVINAIFAVFAMVLLKMVLKREALVAPVAIGLPMILAVRGIFDGGSPALNLIAGLLIVTIIVLTIQRLGLVATTVLFFVEIMMGDAVVTLDPTKWFFTESMIVIAVPAALACYGFYISRGGEPLLGKAVLD